MEISVPNASFVSHRTNLSVLTVGQMSADATRALVAALPDYAEGRLAPVSPPS